MTITRYNNRKLYSTDFTRYINLAELAALVRTGTNFTVVNYADGNDVTLKSVKSAHTAGEITTAELLSFETVWGGAL